MRTGRRLSATNGPPGNPDEGLRIAQMGHFRHNGVMYRGSLPFLYL
jgi:hypothetical protein